MEINFLLKQLKCNLADAWLQAERASVETSHPAAERCAELIAAGQDNLAKLLEELQKEFYL